MTHWLRSSELWILNTAALALICLLLGAASATAQTAKKTPTTHDDDPVFLEYRGIQIGWVADEVRKKFGSPANKSDEQDLFVFSEKEMCQVLYDKTTRKVTAISVDFMNGANGVITPQQVFGSDIEAKSDGSKYKIVRYPKAGYWVAYSRSAGETPTVTVTIQKLQSAP
jgi:hypothetical protein